MLRSSAGLLRVLALDSLRRRAAALPGLLDELRPKLGRALGTAHDAVQSSALRLLADLLPREPDDRAGARVSQHPMCFVLSCSAMVLVCMQ